MLSETNSEAFDVNGWIFRIVGRKVYNQSTPKYEITSFIVNVDTEHEMRIDTSSRLLKMKPKSRLSEQVLMSNFITPYKPPETLKEHFAAKARLVVGKYVVESDVPPESTGFWGYELDDIDAEGWDEEYEMPAVLAQELRNLLQHRLGIQPEGPRFRSGLFSIVCVTRLFYWQPTSF